MLHKSQLEEAEEREELVVKEEEEVEETKNLMIPNNKITKMLIKTKAVRRKNKTM